MVMTTVIIFSPICGHTSRLTGLQAGSRAEKQQKKESNKVNWSDVTEEEADRKQCSRFSAGHNKQPGREG